MKKQSFALIGIFFLTLFFASTNVVNAVLVGANDAPKATCTAAPKERAIQSAKRTMHDLDLMINGLPFFFAFATKDDKDKFERARNELIDKKTGSFSFAGYEFIYKKNGKLKRKGKFDPSKSKIVYKYQDPSTGEKIEKVYHLSSKNITAGDQPNIGSDALTVNCCEKFWDSH